MIYSYFPGCSLEKNAASYNISSIATSTALGMEFVEVEDWNCCGATEYISLNLTASFALIARNLAQATKNDGIKQLVAPCSACYLNLRKCDKYMNESPKFATKINLALAEDGLSYQAGTLKIRHLLDVVVNDVGPEAVKAKVVKPLHGLRIAPYYGCMIVRPDFGKDKKDGPTFDNTEYPNTLDELLKVLGAEVVDFPYKAHCCGGHMTQISESTGFELIRRLIKGADDYHADMIVTLCPMCQLNLDGFQGPMNNYFKTGYKMPVLYFTQMMGLAFGIEPTKLGFGSELVSARQALSKIGVEVPEPEIPEQKPRPKKDDKSLPMPQILKKSG